MTSKGQLEQWRATLCKFTEFLNGAECINDVAQRYIAAGLVDTEEPSESVCRYINEVDEFFETLADALWQKDKDPLWKDCADPESGSSEVH